MKELSRLFPNNELYDICNKIEKEYGLEYPPQIAIARTLNPDLCSYNHITNSISLDLGILNKNMYKQYVEYKDASGNYIKGYIPNMFDGRVSIDTKEEAEKKVPPQGCNLKRKIVPLSDDDKRKYIIFVLAHELRHALQAQIINRSEGLGMYNLLKEKDMQEAGNLIERKLTELNFDKKYRTLEWSKYPQTVIYEKGSKKWEIGNEFYKASLNYTDPNQNALEYHLNLTEADANNSAEKYLDKDYNGFDKLLKGEDLDAFLQKVKI